MCWIRIQKCFLRIRIQKIIRIRRIWIRNTAHSYLCLGKLKSGEDVTLADGRVVRSADVVADMAPPSSYIVIEIPDRLCILI